MRKLLLLAALFLAPLCASATTTVTGHISDLSGTAQTGGTFARFNLRGCSGNQPRVNGVTLIAPTQGGVYYKDFVANGSGNISGTLYSNRDSTGLLAGEIQCGTSYTGTWYGLTIYQAGKAGPETPIYAKNGATLDVTTVVPITTNPVVTAPTGDSTYLRLDAGNSPETGLVGFFTGLTSSKINGILYVGTAAGQYASLQAAHDALPSTGGTIFVMATGTPFGAANTTAFAGTKPMYVTLDCANFTYSGSAAQAISNTSRGVIIEGCGRRGDDVGTSGTTITITNTATNGISNSGNGATFRDFNLIGPASGTGKGVINTAGRATYSNLNISSFGSDGWTNDGTVTNANTVLVLKVRASANGGNGFVTKGTNANLVSFIETDGSQNTGDGYNFSNSSGINQFYGTNADGNVSGIGMHFLNTSNYNAGNVFVDAGNIIQFDAGSANNHLVALSGNLPGALTDNGTNNIVDYSGVNSRVTNKYYTSGDVDLSLILNSGIGAGGRGSSLELWDNGVRKWLIQKGTTNALSFVDWANTFNRMDIVAGAQTDIQAGGTTPVRFNNRAQVQTSTAGVESYSGGGSSAKTAQITGGGLLVDVNAVTPCTNGELALSANWGNTGAPTVTAAAGTGQTCQWTITAGGAATGASPTITDTLTNALPTATIVCDMRMVGGTGTATLINQTSLSATAPIFTFGGTPGVGLTYIVVRRCGP